MSFVPISIVVAGDRPARRPWLALVLAGAFAAGFAANLYEGALHTANGRLELFVQSVVATVLAGWFFHSGAETRASNEFLHWLAAHRDVIVFDGLARHRDREITTATRVRQFDACLSFVLVTVQNRSRFLLEGDRRTVPTGIAYSLVTFVFGWWAFPLGPIATVTALVANARGSRHGTVGQLIEQLDRARGIVGTASPVEVPYRGAPPIGITRNKPTFSARKSWPWRRIVTAVVAAAFAVPLLVQSHQITLTVDNERNAAVSVALDGTDVAVLHARDHRELHPEPGQHRFVVTDRSRSIETATITVPSRKYGLFGRSFVYNVGGESRYALVTVCYGEDCAGVAPEVVAFAPTARFFEWPPRARGTVDEAFGAQEDHHGTTTHLCHATAEGIVVGCNLGPR